MGRYRRLLSGRRSAFCYPEEGSMISEKSGLSVFLAPAGDDRPTTFGKFSAAGQLCGLSGLKKNAGRQPSFHPGWEGTVFPLWTG